ncbi:LacI family transcriptional regulator [Lacrimispora xylanisolvens]|uniref:LacI family transcriptional regulator n=1 Tax=Lacrimispora xylanisolvens TaxID=384636 RepID=A0A2S6HVB4_9FIRM|nr:LacI family DNA-binding transcriptional regulator [Hungatella xylanolytica]PPK81878.1 LacI family transcriptional regulator [Hungatella xylanolytica]
MTLKEIASMAGVSVATVSYVLNNTAQVSDETRKKVEKIIKETGYRSNILAKSLRRNESFLVGVIVEDVTVWHTAYIIDGINEIAEARGYNTILSNLRLLNKIESQFDHISNYQKDIDKALDVMIGMQVDGIIYVGMHDRKISHILGNIKKPVVYCYCYTDGEGSSVRYSNEKTVYHMTKMLIENGHREFGVINGLKESEPAALRYNGFLKALNEAGITMKEENITCGNWKYREGKEAAKKLLNKSDHPTAIVAMNDDMAVGVYDAARELGLKVPDDVSVTGFDNSDIIQYVTPRITTVERPLQEMGYRAMELLLENVSGVSVGDVSITLPCTLIEGESVKKLNQENR